MYLLYTSLALENDLGEVKTSCFFIVSFSCKIKKKNCPQQWGEMRSQMASGVGGAEAKFRGGVVTGVQQLKLYLYIFLSKV